MSRLFALVVLCSGSVVFADSVTLVEAGPNKISVIKVVRDATGLGLKECKTLVESAPAVVKHELSADDAAALVKKLTDVGAKAERTGVGAAPAKPTVGTSREGSWDVVLSAVGPNKILVIKLVREATGLGLKETKDLVESAPVSVKRGVSKTDAEALVGKLLEAGAKAAPSLQKN